MRVGWYILLYHNISWEENAYMRGLGGTCPPDRFREHLTYLAKAAELVSISEGYRRFRNHDIHHPLVSFWFDDGLSGVRRYALPILQSYQVSAAISVCSRFIERTEFFWRFKLSYLSSVDGLRFLRSRLKKYGYRPGDSIKDFTKQHFSLDLLQEIDAIFQQFTSDRHRQDAFRMFEDQSGLLALSQAGWLITNHTAAHYPVSEDAYADHFFEQFVECEHYLSSLFPFTTPEFWVLPFESIGYRIQAMLTTPPPELQKRILVLVGDRMNYSSQPLQHVLFRINAPPCSGKELLVILHDLQTEK